MDGLLLLIFFGLGFGTATALESQQPPPVCPPIERPKPLSVLLAPLPLEYLLPENWQPADQSESGLSPMVPKP